MDEIVRTRFAPSPTGEMHVGNLRTALYAYLVAKHNKGSFILRIEDTDMNRYVEGAVDIIKNILKETELDYDEGPNKEGCNYGPYIQSIRQKNGLYLKYAKELIKEGKAYYCFCDKKRLDEIKQVVNKDGKTISVYDKHCLYLSKEEIKHNLEIGKKYVIRMNMPTEGESIAYDELYGKLFIQNKELEDMILIKSDGFPTYNFANVIDDHLMNITHVIRGNEYISSVHKYNKIYEAFGWTIPKYIHCPLIVDENHKKLSKRFKHNSYNSLIKEGFLPKAVLNFIALLGWNPKNNREIFSLKELIENFDYKNINKSPAVFDLQKLKWMNSKYIKQLDDSEFNKKIYNIIKDFDKNISEDNIYKISSMLKTRLNSFNKEEIFEKIKFFKKIDNYDISLYINSKLKIDKNISLNILNDALQILEKVDESDFNNDFLLKILKNYADNNGLKVSVIMWPIRIALSYLNNTPCGATQIMDIISKNESIKRIKDGINFLKTNL